MKYKVHLKHLYVGFRVLPLDRTRIAVSLFPLFIEKQSGGTV